MKKLFSIAYSKKSIEKIYFISVKRKLNLYKKSIDFQNIKENEKYLIFFNKLIDKNNRKK
jgi:hypothetical protein